MLQLKCWKNSVAQFFFRSISALFWSMARPVFKRHREVYETLKSIRKHFGGGGVPSIYKSACRLFFFLSISNLTLRFRLVVSNKTLSCGVHFRIHIGFL